MQGYTGPINCGANQQSLQNSINALNQAQQNYIQGQTYNAQRRENAVNNWDMGAIRGCYWGLNYYNRPVWICP